MHEKIRKKHFLIEMILFKNFAKININNFLNHLSGLKLFTKRKIKYVMSHFISSTIEPLRRIISIEKCFIRIVSCI